MDVMEAIKTRRSVRKYQQKPVPEEKLKKILEAGRLAPSARNAQSYKFIVVRNPELIKKLAKEATPYHFIGEAPVIIAAVSLKPDYIMSNGVPAYAVDLGIALDHMSLVATSEGLGTCWIGGFYQEPAKKILNIPDKYKVAALMPLGYPADTPGEKMRKSLEELVCYDTFAE
ncbi:nitroreductase family protein [Candidatus Aerophobetes bacterium]|nr:nitroreductase family protein [Candidatus Aerophobetes bacterium]